MKKPQRNPTLHGGDHTSSEIALVLIDVINDLEFPEGRQLLPQAKKAAKQISALKKRAVDAEVPVIYVNDNFGRWKSDFRRQVDHCLNDGVVGEPIARLLKPTEEDYFVLKPKHSGFYSSCLDVLLEDLRVETLILCGLAGDICVLYTANDAYMRDFKLVVPADCIASETKEGNRRALEHMRRYLKARTPQSKNVALGNAEASHMRAKNVNSRKKRRTPSRAASAK